MQIELDSKLEQRVRAFAEASGRTVDEVVQDAVERILEEEPSLPGERMTDEQHAAMMARMRRIRNLPFEGLEDNPDIARNHDKYIYRINW